MTNFGGCDMSTFFSDFAVPVVYNGVTAKGIVDANDSEVSGAPVRMLDRVTQVTVPSSAFPKAKIEGAITIDGIAMKVRDVMQNGDGSLTTIWAVLP